jgi:hypothetical protein
VGGINSTEYDLTDAGAAATHADPSIRVPALKAAVMTIPAYKQFFDAFAGK